MFIVFVSFGNGQFRVRLRGVLVQLYRHLLLQHQQGVKLLGDLLGRKQLIQFDQIDNNNNNRTTYQLPPVVVDERVEFDVTVVIQLGGHEL